MNSELLKTHVYSKTLQVNVMGFILMKTLHKMTCLSFKFFVNVHLAITHLYVWFPCAQ